jgi:hypothetical protein
MVAGCEVLVAMNMKYAVFWIVMLVVRQQPDVSEKNAVFTFRVNELSHVLNQQKHGES